MARAPPAVFACWRKPLLVIEPKPSANAAGHVGELHGVVAHLFGGVRGREGIFLHWEIRNLRVSRGLRLQVNVSAFSLS